MHPRHGGALPPLAPRRDPRPRPRALSARLYIAAKAPRPGLAKTRLARSIGEEAALALYRAFLRDLAARFAPAPFPLGWYVTPPDAWPELAALVDGGGPDEEPGPLTSPALRGGPLGRPRVVVQGQGDWAARQRQLFLRANALGEDRVVLVASDSPQLGVGVVGEAFRALERHDLVFGAVHDGGYYLIGMRGWHDVLAGVAMSTPNALGDVLARARRKGCSVALLEATFDVDEVEDLEHLAPVARARGDLAATAAVLREMGW